MQTNIHHVITLIYTAAHKCILYLLFNFHTQRRVRCVYHRNYTGRETHNTLRSFERMYVIIDCIIDVQFSYSYILLLLNLHARLYLQFLNESIYIIILYTYIYQQIPTLVLPPRTGARNSKRSKTPNTPLTGSFVSRFVKCPTEFETPLTHLPGLHCSSRTKI